MNSTQTQTQTQYLSICEAAAQLGISRSRIYELLRDGELSARKLGRRTLISREAVTAFLAGLPVASYRPLPTMKGRR